MTSILVSIIIILSVLMIVVVLIQKSKGGGLAAGFQSSNQIMGAPKTADFLEKFTWSVMGIIAGLCILCTVNTKKTILEQSSVLQSNAVQSPMSTPENIVTDEAPAQDASEANN